MKWIVFAVLLSFGASSIALAADIPPPPPPPRAPAVYTPAPPPIYNWSGFYLGPNIG